MDFIAEERATTSLRPRSSRCTVEICGLAGLILSCVSLSLIIVSSSVPYWVRDQTIDGEITARGLWMSCSKKVNDSESLCAVLPSVPEYVLAVRAFILMGLFLMASATVLGLIHIVMMKDNHNTRVVAGVIALGAGICMVIGIIIYTARTRNLDPGVNQFHVGFPLTLVAGMVAFAAGFCLILIDKSK